MNDYVEMASMDYNRDSFDIKDGRIVQCKPVWCRDDVIGTAENLGFTLTDDEVDVVLYMLIKRHDAEIGINWDVITFWIEEVVRER